MAFYKLESKSGAPARNLMNRIDLLRNEAGEIEHWISTEVAREIPDDLLKKAEKWAARFGFKVVQADKPEEEENPHPVGDDVRGMSPVNVSGVQQAGAQNQAPSPSAAPSGTPSAAQTQSSGDQGAKSTGDASLASGSTPINS